MRGEEAEAYHRPVMVAEVLAALRPTPGLTVVDATIGGGGHAAAILEAITPGGELIGIDRDREAIAAAQERLDRPGWRIRLLHGRLGEIGHLLEEAGVDPVGGILADLGVSSHQLDAGWRGFSFGEDAPLDMRMDPTEDEGAAELLARISEEELSRILWELGEERRARKIAKAIVDRRPIQTTGALAAAVISATPPRERHGRIHPATRTFQALRIAVNDELGELARFLAAAPKQLAKGARLIVISYHSLEDRLVKQAFRRLATDEGYHLPVRRVIRPDDAEVRANPRARSAKLRVLGKVEKRAGAISD